jgi:hypothetical protein
VAIAIREALYTSRIRLNAPSQAVSVTTLDPEAITLCNVYLLEWAPVTRFNLEALILQLPRPFILMGDYNAHNTLWGDENTQTDRRSRILSSFINDFNLFFTK